MHSYCIRTKLTNSSVDIYPADYDISICPFTHYLKLKSGMDSESPYISKHRVVNHPHRSYFILNETSCAAWDDLGKTLLYTCLLIPPCHHSGNLKWINYEYFFDRSALSNPMCLSTEIAPHHHALLRTVHSAVRQVSCHMSWSWDLRFLKNLQIWFC